MKSNTYFLFLYLKYKTRKRNLVQMVSSSKVLSSCLSTTEEMVRLELGMICSSDKEGNKTPQGRQQFEVQWYEMHICLACVT